MTVILTTVNYSYIYLPAGISSCIKSIVIHLAFMLVQQDGNVAHILILIKIIVPRYVFSREEKLHTDLDLKVYLLNTFRLSSRDIKW